MIEPLSPLSPSRRYRVDRVAGKPAARTTRWLTTTALLLGCAVVVGLCWTAIGDTEAFYRYVTAVGHTLARAE
jgi:ferric-dicitrate binding protein FerR (iron transport regulator)